MRELIGWISTAAFDLPPRDWPISGYPAWLVVEDVSMPMVKIRAGWGGSSRWFNASKILWICKTEQKADKRSHLPRWIQRLQDRYWHYRMGLRKTKP